STVGDCETLRRAPRRRRRRSHFIHAMTRSPIRGVSRPSTSWSGIRRSSGSRRWRRGVHFLLTRGLRRDGPRKWSILHRRSGSACEGWRASVRLTTLYVVAGKAGQWDSRPESTLDSGTFWHALRPLSASRRGQEQVLAREHLVELVPASLSTAW